MHVVPLAGEASPAAVAAVGPQVEFAAGVGGSLRGVGEGELVRARRGALLSTFAPAGAWNFNEHIAQCKIIEYRK